MSKKLLLISLCGLTSFSCRTAEVGRGAEDPASSATERSPQESSISEKSNSSPRPRVKVEILQAIPVSLDQFGVMTTVPKILLDTLSRPRIDGISKIQCAAPFEPDQIVAQLQCASPVTQTSAVRAHAFDQVCGIESTQLKVPSNGRPQIADCSSGTATLQVYTLDDGLRVE